ncbi:MAG TPA: hypothetical protein VLJ80_09115, partial [Solirubrobacteraceae bacterium]|nr:hypothetical protein [Solirubrobacteraceae bacterium]
MKQIKILGLALVAILALAAASMATSAMAVELELPDIHVVLGEAFPVMGEGELLNEGKIVAFIESEIGTKITATHLHVKLELTKLSPLGPLTLLEFRGFGLGATLCNTEGDGFLGTPLAELPGRRRAALCSSFIQSGPPESTPW